MTAPPFHRFVIEGDDGGVASVSLDGIALQGVTRLVLEVNPGDYREPTRLELEFIPGSIRVDASGVVQILGRDL